MGYYKENEGVFLGCISLIESDDPLLRYSGYITAYGFVDKAYRNALSDSYSKDEADMIYSYSPHLSAIVINDLKNARQQAKIKLKKEQKLPGSVKKSAKEVSHVGWDTQDVILDKNDYDASVLLFLTYFNR